MPRTMHKSAKGDTNLTHAQSVIFHMMQMCYSDDGLYLDASLVVWIREHAGCKVDIEHSCNLRVNHYLAVSAVKKSFW